MIRPSDNIADGMDGSRAIGITYTYHSAKSIDVGRIHMYFLGVSGDFNIGISREIWEMARDTMLIPVPFQRPAIGSLRWGE